MPFIPIALPPITTITPGATDVIFSPISNVDLIPGNYKTLDLDSISTLTLHSGDYHFESWNMESIPTLRYDFTDSTPIRVFVQDNVHFGSILGIEIQQDGGGFIDFEVDCEEFDLDELIPKVSFETHGNMTVDPISTWLGLAYAPFGSINFGAIANIAGSLIADQSVVVGAESLIVSAGCCGEESPPPPPPPPPAPGPGEVPEPATAMLGALALGLLACSRRRRALGWQTPAND